MMPCSPGGIGCEAHGGGRGASGGIFDDPRRRRRRCAVVGTRDEAPSSDVAVVALVDDFDEEASGGARCVAVVELEEAVLEEVEGLVLCEVVSVVAVEVSDDEGGPETVGGVVEVEVGAGFVEPGQGRLGVVEGGENELYVRHEAVLPSRRNQLPANEVPHHRRRRRRPRAEPVEGEGLLDDLPEVLRLADVADRTQQLAIVQQSHLVVGAVHRDDASPKRRVRHHDHEVPALQTHHHALELATNHRCQADQLHHEEEEEEAHP
mmetsp:Transcript_10799/g.35783  ORF Transcript_10799/g.35783 Transcript_10799/m.35783 type:complete len:264 (+) Transcript_10799:131-922(+)